MRRGGACALCGAASAGSLVLLAVGGAALLGALLAVLCKRARLDKLEIAVGILRLSWPRFKQSFAILISNFQVPAAAAADAAARSSVPAAAERVQSDRRRVLRTAADHGERRRLDGGLLQGATDRGFRGLT